MTDRAGRSWVTVFNGARDGYQVPLALWEAGVLDALVTDWYSPLDSPVAARLLRVAPRRLGDALGRRFAPGLPSSHVSTSLADALVQRVLPGGRDLADARLGSRAGRRARQRGAGILAYSYYANQAFDAFGDASGPRALFQVQVHPTTLRRVLTEEMRRAPAGTASLLAEPELAASPRRLADLVDAPLRADLCIAPSTYAAASLIENGVDPGDVRVVPYGVDAEAFHPSRRDPTDVFRVMFAGQLIPRKGLAYLLDAWQRLGLPNAELVLVGRGTRDDALLARYPRSHRLVTDVHRRERMRALYESSDVFCMPSLAESFGLVYLEAMACGTPVIATAATGAPDVARDGVDGFLVPPADVDALVQRLAWCHAHRQELHAMRARVRDRAATFTWSRFRRGVVDALAATVPTRR